MAPLCLCKSRPVWEGVESLEGGSLEPRPRRTFVERVLAALTGGDAWSLPGWSPALNAWHFFFGTPLRLQP